jgi:hypothetical protein
MGRLVDIEDVKALISGLDSLPWEEELDDLVKTIPTAYDVEKVVAELEEYKKWYETHGCNADLNRGIIGATNHAVDLVRKGGVE